MFSGKLINLNKIWNIKLKTQTKWTKFLSKFQKKKFLSSFWKQNVSQIQRNVIVFLYAIFQNWSLAIRSNFVEFSVGRLMITHNSLGQLFTHNCLRQTPFWKCTPRLQRSQDTAKSKYCTIINSIHNSHQLSANRLYRWNGKNLSKNEFWFNLLAGQNFTNYLSSITYSSCKLANSDDRGFDANRSNCKIWRFIDILMSVAQWHRR